MNLFLRHFLRSIALGLGIFVVLLFLKWITGGDIQFGVPICW